MARRWPVVLSVGDVRLRPLRRGDEAVWFRLRATNLEWLARWEATSPIGAGSGAPSFPGFLRILRRQARRGTDLPFGIEYRGELVGQLTVSGITRGSLWSGSIGYWVSEQVAGRGIVPTAVALAVDHCMRSGGLHRIEINIRPENGASLRVVDKLGFRDEGVRLRFLHIDGDWRDHRTFALTREEVPEGLLSRLERLPG
jgi:ribosomal-protein-alanine N-acetyltransferase